MTATQLGSGGRWPAGEGGQVVDVQISMDEAALHLHHIVVSLLLAIEEEEDSYLVGAGNHKPPRSESQPGDDRGHFGRL